MSISSMLGALPGVGAKRLRPPPIEDSQREAAQQHLAKEAKIQVAEQAVWLEDLRDIARDNRTSWYRYRDKVAGDHMTDPPEGDDMGDLTVADAITHHHHHQPPKFGFAKALLSAGLLAAGGYGAFSLIDNVRDWFPPKETTIENTTKQQLDIVPEWAE